MAHSRRAMALTVVAGVAALGLGGCGGDKEAPDDAFAGKSADRIAADAVRATRQADSMHVKGTTRQESGGEVAVDLAVDRRKNCEGTVTVAGTRADVRHLDGTLYLRGDRKYWQAALKRQPGADKVVPKLEDKWVKTPASDAMTKNLCDKQSLVASMDEDKSQRRGLKKSGTTSVDGTKALKLTKRSAEGGTLSLYVAAEGEPYVLRTTESGGRSPNSATFSDYGKAVRPEKPSPDETVDLGALAAGARGA
ncbi:hypothetical protein ACTWJ8_32455 [Streptomyces sp. SDT5-1]|uniref:hypothetical protein n=1 Tax=Streptomyces sp. SDT5-1 TaxID=3406418 RepID=UPI003FD0CF45